MKRAFFRKSIAILSFAFAGIAITAPNTSAQHTQRGAVLGGLGGAVVGGLIGDHNHKAGAGAAIGGALGVVGGAVLGNARDKEINAQHQQQQYYHQQHVYAQQQRQYVQTQAAVSINDVITMCRSGLNDSVVMNQIQARGVQRQLQVSDIITMHQQGVSDIVISTMQSARVGGGAVYSQPQPIVVQQAPIYVEEHVIVPHYQPAPVYIYSGHSHHHRSYHGF